MKVFSWIDEYLAKLERILIVTTLTGMLLLAFLQVVLRNLWGLGLPWVDILLRHVVLWLAIVGASLATRMKRHIRIPPAPAGSPGSWTPGFAIAPPQPLSAGSTSSSR